MNDLISRQDVLDEFLKFSGYLDKDMIIRTYIGLNRLPSAQPEQKVGKWIEGKCSECGEHAPFLVNVIDILSE